MTPPSQAHADALTRLKAHIVEHLDRIERLCKRRGVPMSQITLIMRDPADDQMFVALTTETPDGLKKAFGMVSTEAAS